MAPGTEDKRNHAGRCFCGTFCGWRVFPIGREERPDGTRQQIPGPHMRGAKWLGIV